jgi:hypothetical protein
MTTVEKLGGNWVIVRDRDVSPTGEVGGALEPEDADSSPVREFWTGDAWVGQYGLAKLFVTNEEADAYLAQHRHDLA